MDNLNFVISFKFKGQEDVQKLFKEIGKKHNIEIDIDTSKVQLGLQQVQKPIKEFRENIVSTFSSIGFMLNGIEQSFQVLKNTINSVIDPAANFESLQTRLENLYGSADKAASVFEKFKEIAATTPFQLEEVVEAGIQLKAFGMKAEDTLKSVADLAAFMGVDIVDAANAMGRAFAGGVGAADVLRERGILNLIKSFKGIDDLSKLTLPEFRQAMKETFEDSSVGIAGATDKLSKTYQGAISNMKDAITNFRAEVGKHLLPLLEKGAKTVTNFFRNITETPIEQTIREMRELGVESEKIIELQNYARKIQLAEIDEKLEAKGLYQDINTLTKRYEELSKNIITIEKTKADIMMKHKYSYDEIFETLRKIGYTEEEAREHAKGLSDEINAGMSGKALMDFYGLMDNVLENLKKEAKTLNENKDLILEREKLEKQLNATIEKRKDEESNNNIISQKEIDDAKKKIEAFFNSLKTEREQLENEYKNKKSLIEIAYSGNPEEIKTKLEALDKWYKTELKKIKDAEENAKRQQEQAEIDAKKREYMATIQLLQAKKQLGMNVDNELRTIQRAYTEWVKEQYGEESAEYINAVKQMRDANLRFTQSRIENFRRSHFVIREVTDSLVAGFRTAWGSILDSSMTGKQRLNAIWVSMRNSFMDAVGDMVANWIKKHLIMRAIVLANGKIERAETLKTAAVEKASILSTIALKIKSAMTSIGVAIANIFKFLANIMGPLAIVAGAVVAGLLMSKFDSIRKRLGFAEGGIFKGFGGDKDDANIIAVSNGEYIVNADATRRFLPLLNAINFGGDIGGMIGGKFAYSGGGIVAGGNEFLDELRAIREEVSNLREDVYKAAPRIPPIQVIEPERLSEIVEEGNIKRGAF